MFRKALPFLLLAVLGGAGLFTWRNLNSPAPTPTTEVIQIPAPRPTTERARPQTTRLDFLTDTAQLYQARIIQLRNSLAGGASEPELRFLYQLLKQPPPKSELPEHWFVIINDIFSVLSAHETDPQRFAANLTEVLGDSQQSEVIRDYSVQHLALWIKPRPAHLSTSSLPAVSPEIAAQVLQAFAAATVDPALEQSTIPGTTLMMLVELTRSGSGLDCSQAIATLQPWLSQALQDGSTLSTPTRVSAVSAAGVLAPAEFRPVIRQIAFQENGSSALRLPAIAALGQAGEEEDLSKLKEIAATSPEFSYAAADAATALSSRLDLVQSN